MFSFVLSEPCLRVLSFVSCTFSMFGQTAAHVTIVQDERLTVREMELKAEAKRRWRAEEATRKAEKERKRSEERAALLKTASAKAAVRKVRATRKAERARERKGVRGQRGTTRVRLASGADRGATATSFELRPLPRRKSAGLASVMEEDEESVLDEKAPALYLVNSISKSHDALVVDQDEELAPLIFTSPVKGGPEKSAFLRKAMLGDMKKQCGRQTRKLVRKIRWQPVQ